MANGTSFAVTFGATRARIAVSRISRAASRSTGTLPRPRPSVSTASSGSSKPSHTQRRRRGGGAVWLPDVVMPSMVAARRATGHGLRPTVPAEGGPPGKVGWPSRGSRLRSGSLNLREAAEGLLEDLGALAEREADQG